LGRRGNFDEIGDFPFFEQGVEGEFAEVLAPQVYREQRGETIPRDFSAFRIREGAGVYAFAGDGFEDRFFVVSEAGSRRAAFGGFAFDLEEDGHAGNDFDAVSCEGAGFLSSGADSLSFFLAFVRILYVGEGVFCSSWTYRLNLGMQIHCSGDVFEARGEVYAGTDGSGEFGLGPQDGAARRIQPNDAGTASFAFSLMCSFLSVFYEDGGTVKPREISQKAAEDFLSICEGANRQYELSEERCPDEKASKKDDVRQRRAPFWEVQEMAKKPDNPAGENKRQ